MGSGKSKEKETDKNIDTNQASDDVFHSATSEDDEAQIAVPLEINADYKDGSPENDNSSTISGNASIVDLERPGIEQIVQISEVDAKKNDMLVEMKRMIRECKEIRHELAELKSYVQYKYDFKKACEIRRRHTIAKLNYSTLIATCRKIIVESCSLDKLSTAELQFMQEIAYEAVIRKETKAKLFKEDSPDLNVCLARVGYLRSIVNEARENANVIRMKMIE